MRRPEADFPSRQRLGSTEKYLHPAARATRPAKSPSQSETLHRALRATLHADRLAALPAGTRPEAPAPLFRTLQEARPEIKSTSAFFRPAAFPRGIATAPRGRYRACSPPGAFCSRGSPESRAPSERLQCPGSYVTHTAKCTDSMPPEPAARCFLRRVSGRFPKGGLRR